MTAIETLPAASPPAPRSHVSERRLLASRRQIRRQAARFSVLFAGDLLAAVVSIASLRLIAEHSPTWFAGFDPLSSGPVAGPGRPGGAVFLIALLLALPAFGSYGRSGRVAVTARIAAAVSAAAVVAGVALAAVLGVANSVVYCLLVAIVVFLMLLLFRSAAERFLRHVWPRGRGAAPAVLVRRNTPASPAALRAIRAPGSDYRIVAELDSASAGLDDSEASAAIALIERVEAEALIVCDDLPDDRMEQLLEIALEAGCDLVYPPRAVHLRNGRPRLVWHADEPFVELGAAVLRPNALITKRAFDVVVSLLLFLVAAPLFVVLAVATRLDSPGPVFFAQDRAGLGGRRFRMHKFRTMRIGADAEKENLAHLNHTGDARLFKIPHDPRVTKAGAVLRRWSLDELPQLWNVLKGEMSLVGPRPFFEADFAVYEDHHFRRLDTKPGMSGLWQVSGRSEVVSFEDVVFLDRQYIENWSLWLDVSILLRTIPAVIRRTGAY